MTAFETILYDVEGPVATITLNRPEEFNTIVPPMPDEIEAAVHEAVRDEHVKVVVLRGAGRAFCGGFNFGKGFHHWDKYITTDGEWDPVAQITLNLLTRLSVRAVAMPGAPVSALARYPDGKALDIWVTGNDGQVYTAFYNDDGVPWRGWFPVSGPVPSGLPAGAPVSALAPYPTGRAIGLFLVGNDGRLDKTLFNDDSGSWNGWLPIP